MVQLPQSTATTLPPMPLKPPRLAGLRRVKMSNAHNLTRVENKNAIPHYQKYSSIPFYNSQQISWMILVLEPDLEIERKLIYWRKATEQTSS